MRRHDPATPCSPFPRRIIASWRGLLIPLVLLGVGCTGGLTGVEAPNDPTGEDATVVTGDSLAERANDDPLARRQRVESLAQRGDGPEVDTALLTALTDPDGAVRRVALRAAADRELLDVGDFAQTLIDPHPAVRDTAYRIVRRRGLEGSVTPPLKAALTDPDPHVRARSVVMLARLDMFDTDGLATLVADEDTPVRRAALMELIRRQRVGAGVGDPVNRGDGLIETLSASLEHDDPVVRALVINVLAHAGGMTFAQLETALADDHPRVREAAERALSQLPESDELERLGWLVQGIELPTHGWRLRVDPEQRGREARWFDPDFDDADWQEVEVGRPWGEFGHEDYIGDAWYRREIEVPDVLEGAGVLKLEFLGVDESAWVWVNGRFVGEHDMGPAGWDVPFSVPVTDEVSFGQANQITVLVRNTTGAGGIWKPVWLRPQ